MECWSYLAVRISEYTQHDIDFIEIPACIPEENVMRCTHHSRIGSFSLDLPSNEDGTHLTDTSVPVINNSDAPHRGESTGGGRKHVSKYVAVIQTRPQFLKSIKYGGLSCTRSAT